MKAILVLVGLASLLVLVGGVGFVAAMILHADGVRIGFGYALYASLLTTGAALAAALCVGMYHLYLYFFTDRKPLGLFATVRRDAAP